MAKPDYKQRSTQNTKKKPSVAMPFTAGLCCGVFASFLTYLYFGQAPIQQAHNVGQTPSQIDHTPATSPSKPLNNPNFEFYTMLDKQTPAPIYQPPVEVKPKPKVTTETTPSAAKSKSQYMLQIQSFESRNAADGLRGALILQNYQNVTIQQVTIDNKTWYRVNMGPFPSKQKARSAQARLPQYKTMIKSTKS